MINLTADWYGSDLTLLFQPRPSACPIPPSCIIPNKFPQSPPLGPNPGQSCPDPSWLQGLKPKGKLYFTWDDIHSKTMPHQLMVFNGGVINVTNILATNSTTHGGISTDIDGVLRDNIGRDGTLVFASSDARRMAAMCWMQTQRVGVVDTQTTGCLAVQVINAFALVTVMGLVLTRFFMAITFSWFLSQRLTKPKYRSIAPQRPRGEVGNIIPGELDDGEESPFVILLVTCYSEAEDGIRSTLESLASTKYPDSRKLLFVICDGLITGSGNEKSTPDIVVGMMKKDDMMPPAEPKSYIAIAEGKKQHNMGLVHSGHFECQGHSVPMIAVVKCGTAEEGTQKKPGNRGKRDSQMLIMNFLSSLLDEEGWMHALHHELSIRIQSIAHIAPIQYNIILMVDADTVVAEDSLRHMTRAMNNDPWIM
ncbi:hypothetical protein HK096_010153, partial [Nowakowskiella sp. JEL0078]